MKAKVTAGSWTIGKTRFENGDVIEDADLAKRAIAEGHAVDVKDVPKEEKTEEKVVAPAKTTHAHKGKK